MTWSVRVTRPRADFDLGAIRAYAKSKNVRLWTWVHQAALRGRVEEAFGGSGRVLVRFSGTEPLARVMVEGPDLEQVESFSASIADVIRREMGA